MRIGFVGTGAMGAPMARNLLAAGHEVAAWNRTRSRAEALAGEGATIADTPAAAARGAGLAFTMLSDDDAVEAAALGREGIAEGLAAGAVHVCSSTIGPRLSRRLLEAHAARGQSYVAAPVFGRPEMAAAGKLWIVAGGPADAVQAARPALDVLGQGTIEAGERPEDAHALKLAGNFLIASALEAMGEAYAFAGKRGIPAAAVYEVLSRLFPVPIYQGYGALIRDGRYEPAGFRLRHGRKDVRLVLQAAEEDATPLPLASLLRDRFLAAAARGWDDIDWSGIARLSAEGAGLG